MYKVSQVAMCLVLIFSSDMSFAQSAENFVKFIVEKIQSDDLSVFDEDVKKWILAQGAGDVGMVRNSGPAKDVAGATSTVYSSLWSVTGRSIHDKGIADWLIIYSSPSEKVVRLRVNFVPTGEEVPNIPELVFRGDGPRSTQRLSDLNVCRSLPVLCRPDGLSTDDERLVEFLFATNRRMEKSAEKVTFSGDRGQDLSYGAAQVRIPRDHRIGRVELPRRVSIFGIKLYEQKQDPEKHFLIKYVTPLSSDEWIRLASEKQSKEALVFVHGYNNSFE